MGRADLRDDDQDQRVGPTQKPSGHAPDGNPHTLLVVDGALGDYTIRATQWKIKTPADGLFGNQTTIALQKHLGIAADSILGPRLSKPSRATSACSRTGTGVVPRPRRFRPGSMRRSSEGPVHSESLGRDRGTL